MPDNYNNMLLQSSQMTPVVTAVPGSSQEYVNIAEGSTQVTTNVTPSAPSFEVPANPLLPPGYQETLDYASLQYANGFYRTQIGRYVRLDQLMGGNDVTHQEGFLIGVGYNYLLLQEGYTGNILVVDIYSVKNMYIHYNNPVPAYLDAAGAAEEMDI